MTTRRIVMVVGVISFLASLVLRIQANPFLATVAISVSFALMVTAIAMGFTGDGVFQIGPILIGVGILFVYRSAYLFGYSAATQTSDFAGMVSVILGVACMVAAALVLRRPAGATGDPTRE